ncbi:MAG: aromatic aminobenezylarsenical efflux permease ArsG family transporter [Candidatus Paceibacterota bacterium]
MGLMAFMETMGTSSIPIVAAFFIGLMAALSPCPLATNITAIAYASKKIDNSKHTIIVGLLYTLGRMFTYVVLALSIVTFGMNMQSISLFMQNYGNKILGPFLVIAGLIMLNIIRLNILRGNKHFINIKEKLAAKGFIGSFLLGMVFALAFCPFSALLFFGMLIPLALKAGDGILIPSVFAFATGLPVIVFSFILVKGMSKLGKIMNKVNIFERWMRFIVAVIFIITGIYYTFNMVLNWI